MKLNKVIAVILALALMLALCGCYNPQRVITHGETEITGGQYLMYQYVAASEILDEQEADSLAQLLRTKIDGVDAADYIQQRAVQYIKEALYVQSEFDRLELEFDALTEYQMIYYAQYYWTNTYSSALQRNGVGYTSYEYFTLMEERSSLLFSTYYGAGGEFEVPVSELMDYYNQNYSHVQLISFPTTGSDSTAISDANLAAMARIAAQMAEAVNGGMSINDCVLTYYPQVQELLGYAASEFVTADTVSNLITSATMNEGSTTYAANVIEAALGLEVGQAGYAQAEKNIYVFVRTTAFTDEEGFATYQNTALSGLKREEYQDYISAKAAEEIEVTVDEKALEYYAVKNIKGL